MDFNTDHQLHLASEAYLGKEALDRATQRLRELLAEAQSRNPGLPLLAAEKELITILVACVDMDAAYKSSETNFDQLNFLTDHLLAKDALSLNRSEERDGPLAAALNIMDSFEALIAKAAAGAQEPAQEARTSGLKTETALLADPRSVPRAVLADKDGTLLCPNCFESLLSKSQADSLFPEAPSANWRHSGTCSHCTGDIEYGYDEQLNRQAWFLGFNDNSFHR